MVSGAKKDVDKGEQTLDKLYGLRDRCSNDILAYLKARQEHCLNRPEDVLETVQPFLAGRTDPRCWALGLAAEAHWLMGDVSQVQFELQIHGCLILCRSLHMYYCTVYLCNPSYKLLGLQKMLWASLCLDLQTLCMRLSHVARVIARVNASFGYAKQAQCLRFVLLLGSDQTLQCLQVITCLWELQSTELTTADDMVGYKKPAFPVLRKRLQEFEDLEIQWGQVYW